MDKALLVLSLNGALVPAFAVLAFALRRRVVLPRAAWLALETLPALIVWLSSWSAVWLFSHLVRSTPVGPFADLAVASAFIPTLPVALSPSRYRARVAGVVLALLAFLVLADTVYYRFFGGVLPLLAFNSATHVWDVRDSIIELVTQRELWLLTLIAPALALLVLWPLAPVGQRPPWWLGLVVSLSLTVVCVHQSKPIQKDVDDYLALSRSWKVLNVLGNLKYGGLIVTHARDIATTLREREHQEVLSTTDRERVEQYVAEHHRQAREYASDEGFGAIAGANVLMVQLEAIQGWAVDVDVGGQPVMPFLRSLKEQGLYFPNVFDQTGGSPTSDCEYLALNGLHPLARGSVAFRRPGNDFVALPEVLRAQGYKTLSLHAYLRGMWNRGVVHPRYGFESSYFRREIGDEPKLGWGMGDKPFFERVVSVLKEQKQPFFAFAITLTSHHPYKYVPDDLATLDTRGVPTAVARYLRSARYVDEALAELFGALKSSGLMESTAVVLYGDHDAKLKLNAKTAQGAAKKLNLDAATLRLIGTRNWSVDRVPLFLVPPAGHALRGEVATVGGQIDIGPTLLHYLGVAAPRSFLGLPLLAAREGWVARYDGYGADPQLLLSRSKKGRACRARAVDQLDGESVARRCEELKQRVDAQTDASAFITLHDLARELSASGAPRSR